MTSPGTAFPHPLNLSVASNNPLLTDLAGGVITYTVVPVNGASATLSAGTATISTINATTGTYTVVASAGGGATTTFHLTNGTPVSVVSTTIGDSTTRRSQVRQLTVVFSKAVQLAAGAFTLALSNSGGSGTDSGGPPTDATASLGTPATTDGGVTWVIAIAAGTTFGEASGSLKDGVYTLTVHAGRATAVSGGQTLPVDAATTFHRLFGDTDGNKTVNALDYAKFKTTFGSSSGAAAYNASLDFDNNGTINALDYAQFKKRFGLTFTY